MLSQLLYITTTTTTVGVQPPPFSVQFWVFPLLFILLPAAFFVAVAGAIAIKSGVELDADSLIFLFVYGMMLGSWFGLFANIVPLGMSILFTIAMVIYVWRGGGQQG